MIQLQLAVFMRDDCVHCPSAKEVALQLSKDGIDVRYYDVDTPTGLAKAMKLGVRSLPTIILLANNDEEQSRWVYPNIPRKEDIVSYMS